jgi:hypothetical protein
MSLLMAFATALRLSDMSGKPAKIMPGRSLAVPYSMAVTAKCKLRRFLIAAQ